MTKTVWGWHLTIDASDCDPFSIKDYATIYDFAKELVEKIDMVPFGEPQINHFGSGNKAGYTLVQLIETSNITAHFVNDVNAVFLDVFSCKPFVLTDVENVFHTYFAPEHYAIAMKERSYVNCH